MTQEILRVSVAGEFIWHPEADRLIEEGDFSYNPALQYILRKLRKDDTALFEQVLDALEIGYASAMLEAQRYHQEMQGYRQHRHDQLDADVVQIGKAISAVLKHIDERSK